MSPLGVTYTRLVPGLRHTLACRSDGAVIAWGWNANGQCNVPILPPGVTFLEVAAGDHHSVALRSDGTAVAWGLNADGQCSVPGLSAGLSYVEIAADANCSAARRSDGTLLAWGNNTSGQSTVPTLASGLSYLGVSAGFQHTVARHTRRFYLDVDQDGFGLSSAALVSAPHPPGYALTGGDCNDANVQVFPGAAELCDGLDNDCDGQIDEGFTSTYCTAGTSVHGCTAQIAGVGTPSTTAGSGFNIVVSNVPGQRYGTIFYGFYPANVPWAPNSPSYRCVSFPIQRMGNLSTHGSTNQCNGDLTLDFNSWYAANPGALAAPFIPGQVFYAQGWYRDPAAPKQTNLSNGLRFTLCN